MTGISRYSGDNIMTVEISFISFWTEDDAIHGVPWNELHSSGEL